MSNYGDCVGLALDDMEYVKISLKNLGLHLILAADEDGQVWMRDNKDMVDLDRRGFKQVEKIDTVKYCFTETYH